MNSLLDSDSHLCHGESAKSSHLIDENNEYAQSCLDAVMEAVWKDDDQDEFCREFLQNNRWQGSILDSS